MSYFDLSCRKCPRLSDYLDKVKAQYPDYHCAPVAPFGDPDAKLLIVGLAPGMHGANATGRPFTGDYAGILLYETLYKHGFGSQEESLNAQDGLALRNCRITNAVKCLPPANKPLGPEIRQCNDYLVTELESLPEGAVILALGHIAHQAVVRASGQKLKDYPFGHGRWVSLPTGHYLLDSYHCSRYNTATRRLTAEMFTRVFDTAKRLLNADG
ncbi:MAG: uracil-DNA glycosylase [Pseudomonadota bacterium]|nr:uracil-DNA glycosylase [Pseudomonadota bacterium]